MTIARLSSGKRGEALAYSFLRREGYKILEKNYKTRLGEIDIIGEDEGSVVFIEIRSANTERFGSLEHTINKKKQDRITKTALSYIKRYGLEDKDCRFDVVCIESVDSVSPRINLIRDAFEPDQRYAY